MKFIPSAVKSALKRQPHLYDFVIGVIKRNVLRERSPAYEILNEFSKSRGGRVSFVQIGANDGLRNDPIREFIVRDPWTGVLIEPLPSVFELLKENYAWLAGRRSLAFENPAISTSESSLSLYTVADHLLNSLPLEAHSISCENPPSTEIMSSVLSRIPRTWFRYRSLYVGGVHSKKAL